MKVKPFWFCFLGGGKGKRAYISKEEALQRQIMEEEERKELLEEKKKYVTTNKYVEEVARDRLGFLYPDEVLLQEKTD